MKKGQGISVNVIVIAALALLVLVILATIVINKIGGFNKDASICGRATSGEVCRDLADGCPTEEGYLGKSNKPCVDIKGNNDNTRICCLKG